MRRGPPAIQACQRMPRARPGSRAGATAGVPRPRWRGGLAEAQSAQGKGGQRERNRVRAEDRFGPTHQQHRAAVAGPAIKPKSAIAPNSEVAAGSRRASTRLGRLASAAGVNRPVPTPASRASKKVPTNPSTSTRPRKATPAGRPPDDHARSPRPAVRDGPEQRAQQHRRHDVGQENEPDRPRRIEPVQRDEQQRDVGGPSAQRGLRERGEEHPRPPLVPQEFDHRPHQLRPVSSLQRLRFLAARPRPRRGLGIFEEPNDGRSSGASLPFDGRKTLHELSVQTSADAGTLTHLPAECQLF